MLLAPKYRETIVPSAEDSGSRAPDLNVQARVGLFMSGRVSNWCCRLVADGFESNTQWDWNPVMVGHPHLRALTTQASLGARHFMLSCRQREEDGQPNLILDDGIAQFLHMLGKGIIVPPRPEQMKNISPVVISIPHSSERFAATETAGHDYHAGDIGEREFVFGRLENWWGMAPTEPTDLSRLLWERDRQFGNYIPNIGRHGCGLVTLVPGPPVRPLTRYPWWKTVWATDGDSFLNHESVRDTDQKILAAMEHGVAQVPFRVQGDVYYQLVEQDENTYHLYLVDPGLVYPAACRATVTAERPGRWIARDRISGGVLAP